MKCSTLLQMRATTFKEGHGHFELIIYDIHVSPLQAYGVYYTPFKLAKKQWMSSTVRPLFVHCSSTVHPRPLFVHVSLKGTGNLREFAGMKTVDEQWTNSGRTVDEVRARPSRVNTERSLENVRCSPQTTVSMNGHRTHTGANRNRKSQTIIMDHGMGIDYACIMHGPVWGSLPLRFCTC